jgi:4-hydroxybenzoate polyprenyltransferase
MEQRTCARPRDIRLFLALSRTPHLLLDVAAPMVAALLCLGRFPNASTIILGLITVFAGYACVYALNDVTDYHLDRERMGGIARQEECFDLDCMFVRHPLAQGLVPFKSAVIWTVLWGTIALMGATVLNPICAGIFILGGLLEAAYCKLYRLTQWKILIAAAVKTLGGVAAIFAVNPRPSPGFVVLFFLWIAFWEVGGQNVPNDLVDMEEDGRLGARTIPLVYGTHVAVFVMLVALVAGVVLGFGVVFASPLPRKWLYVLGATVSGVVFLLLPYRTFLEQGDPGKAVNLFNRASLYPLGILVTTVLCLAR